MAEQLRAAVAFGADAVYLAAERFGMRARAANFRMDEIPAAVAFAHDHGVKVHVTCNILMHPDDIDGLPPFFRALDAAGVDAFIIGDVGAFAVAGEVAPRVERHVSTQASVANATAARVWHSLGASRVVCAREMSLADIARLRQDAPPDLEIEAFAHGAMCMAVSGRCLISSYLTGRSGNKGHCTQPCRWSYQLDAASPAATRPDEPAGGDLGRPSPASVVELPQSENAIGIQGGLKSAPTEFAAGRPVEFLLEEEKRPGEFFPIEEDDRGTFIMNAKDLNMLAHLQALADAGVDSIKIEGRNKKAFYVATVVGAYRRVLDGEPPMRWLTSFWPSPTAPTARASTSPRRSRPPPTTATNKRPCTSRTSSPATRTTSTSCAATASRKATSWNSSRPRAQSPAHRARPCTGSTPSALTTTTRTPLPRWKRPSHAPPPLTGKPPPWPTAPATSTASSWKVARAVVPLPLTCPRVPSSANAPSAAPPAMAVRRIS